MSRYVSQRKETAVEFIETARKLSTRLKISCANAGHKKYTFYGLQDVSRYSSELLKTLLTVNRLDTKDYDQMRRRLVLEQEARGLLDSICCLFGELELVVHFSNGVLNEVGQLLEKEERLLAGLYKADREKAKSLKPGL